MTCSLCGEEITAPHFFEGKAFGSTCIKVVNPAYKNTKKKKKELWWEAETFGTVTLENGIIKVTARVLPNENCDYFSGSRKFVEYHHPKKWAGEKHSIIIQGERCFVNILDYNL